MKTLIERLRENGYGALAAVVVSKWLEDMGDHTLDGGQAQDALYAAAAEAVRDLPPDAFERNA